MSVSAEDCLLLRLVAVVEPLATELVSSLLLLLLVDASSSFGRFQVRSFVTLFVRRKASKKRGKEEFNRENRVQTC